jgi:DNA-binding NarL/FixJ family response regulator
MDKVSLVLADDQKLFVESLRNVLETRGENLTVVGVASNGREALDLVRRHKPDIVLMDVRMPVMDGVEATAVIHRDCPGTQVIMLTTYDDDEFVHKALANGAVGYLLKETHPSNLIAAILAVKEGSVLISPCVVEKLVRDAAKYRGNLESLSEEERRVLKLMEGLSRREKEVLQLLAEGNGNRAIAAKMFLSAQTVRNHISVIYSKIGVHDRIEILHLLQKTSRKD